MPDNKIVLTFEDDEEEELPLGLCRLAYPMEDFQFFYKLNRLNDFKFCRTKDIVIKRGYYKAFFNRFEAYDSRNKTHYIVVVNRSHTVEEVEQRMNLFSGIEHTEYLFSDRALVDYILLTKGGFGDFSLILLPKEEVLQVEELVLSSQHELFDIIQCDYYD